MHLLSALKTCLKKTGLLLALHSARHQTYGGRFNWKGPISAGVSSQPSDLM